GVGLGVIRIDADDVERLQVGELDSVERGELSSEDEMEELPRLGLCPLLCRHDVSRVLDRPPSASQVYAASAFDELGVQQWRGGDKAREAGIGQIEAEGVAVMVCHDPACLLDQQHAGREIPIAFG